MATDPSWSASWRDRNAGGPLEPVRPSAADCFGRPAFDCAATMPGAVCQRSRRPASRRASRRAARSNSRAKQRLAASSGDGRPRRSDRCRQRIASRSCRTSRPTLSTALNPPRVAQMSSKSSSNSRRWPVSRQIPICLAPPRTVEPSKLVNYPSTTPTPCTATLYAAPWPARSHARQLPSAAAAAQNGT